ncbi:MAG: prolipoprotein diacylglyceryl transferase [Salibacteraceae bacterium]
MMRLLYITWNVDPTLFEYGPISVRWYGLFFAIAFLVGYYIMQHILKREEKPSEWMDSLLIYMMVGTIAGARLGHVFFYQWDYYQHNLLEILQIWKGGLASHGATIGILISLWIWGKRISKTPYLWILDRIVITIALAAVFIRTGNLMNHEIVGAPFDGSWAFLFLRAGYEELVPRHPAQIYEALSYLILFAVLATMYFKTTAKNRPGLLFGTFLMGLFSARFIIEFYKEVQVSFEQEMTLNMGQWLSLPLIALGLFFVLKGFTKKAGTEHAQ